MKMATISFQRRCTLKQLFITILALVQMCLILLIMEKYFRKMEMKRFVGLDRQTNVSNYDFYFDSLGQSKSKFFAALRTNSIYKSFGVKLKKRRQSVNLLLVVSSAPKRSDRRAGIRETWWTLCRNTMRERDRRLVTVKCIFMTDKQSNDSIHYDTINKEMKEYNDVELQDLQGGVEFGRRYMYHLYWAVANYDFDYFVRMDDDYFLCLDKILNELPLPMLPLFHWGWTHCIKDIVRPEESIIMFSYDVVKAFLSQVQNKTFCHPWADQLIGVWVEETKIPITYRTDKRLHHDPPAEALAKFKTPADVCKNFAGIHGSYPNTMRNLWLHRGKYNLKNETLLTNSVACNLDIKFKWTTFHHVWRYQPQLCVTNPNWDTRKQGNSSHYGGRQFNELGVQ